MTLARNLAEEIAESGPAVVFGLPGGGPSLELIDALDGHGVGFVRTVHEASAGLMAGTWGRLTGRAGVAVSIKGPGLANLVPGLAFSRLEAYPLVAVAEAYPPSAPPARAHKRMDHSALVAAVVKGQRAVSPDGPSFGDWAAWAEAEVPGPVQLDLATEAPSATPRPPEAPPPVAHDTARALDLLAAARRPVVVAGTLALRRGWGDLLADLRVPVFSTAAAKGVMDESLEHAAGVYTGVGGELAPESFLLPEAELVVGLGLRSNEVLSAAPFAVPALNVDPLGGDASPGYDFAATLPPERLPEVAAELAGRAWGAQLLATSRSTLESRLLAPPFLPARVYRSVEECFHGDARLVVDTGNFCTIAEHIWTARTGDAYLGAGQSRYMGTAVPMGIAAALHDRHRPTVVAVGDGGVGMAFGELKLAVEHRLPLLVVLMADGGFASIRQRAQALDLVEEPLLMARPSWHAAAAGLGMDSAVAEDAASLERTLAAWSPDSGPLFLECRFDADTYLPMTQRLR